LRYVDRKCSVVSASITLVIRTSTHSWAGSVNIQTTLDDDLCLVFRRRRPSSVSLQSTTQYVTTAKWRLLFDQP